MARILRLATVLALTISPAWALIPSGDTNLDMKNILAAPGLKLAAIPTTAPGAGVCMEAWVPANLTTPAGTTGTCSKIAMCGTSTAYSIEVASVGSGC